MSGVVADNVTTAATQTDTVERAGSVEIFRRLVRADGNRCAASTDVAHGTCRVRSTTAGDLVPVDVQGRSLVEAGAAIALTHGSAAVMSDAQGRAIPHAGSNPVAGRVLLAASAAGDILPIQLTP